MLFSAEVTDNLLDTILNTALNGVLVVEAVTNTRQDVVDFRYVFVNKAARDQAYVLKNVSTGMTMRNVLADIDFKGVLPVCQAVLLTGKPYQGERFYSDTGEWFNTHFARINDNQLTITFTNITALKRAVIDQQQQAELFQSVLGSTINPVVVCKPICLSSGQLVDLQVVLFNPAAYTAWLFGTDLQVGANANNLLPQPERSLLLDHCQKVLQTGEAQRFLYRYSNSSRWFSLAVQRFNQGLIINATDVTEERQQQSVLLAMNRALEQSNENLQQFAYIASHDLQEPLRKIHSFGDVLQTQFADQLGPAGADLIRRMQSASGRMTTLIQDLLTYSRLTTHGEPFKPVSVGRLLDEIIEDISPLLQDGEATVDCDNLPTLPGDESQLRQLFQNLLINGVIYRHPDRPAFIQVRCRTLTSNELPDDLPAQNQYVEISVADNGIGFDEKYRERIFQMFQRLHGRNQYTGTGVGLAICKRVVENHYGHIWATSRLGEGSIFRVVLPV